MADQFFLSESQQPTMGIYIHIPFCVKKCDYCDFYSLSGTTPEERGLYHQALLDWISQASGDAAGCVVDTVYIGGGTPSCYDPDRLAEVLDLIRGLYALTPDCEITAECNPDTVTETLLNKWKAAGINRLSMGVQSANDDELRAVGRVHDFATAKNAVRLAREAGFDNISLDLIYGLPGQTMQSWQHSVEALIALAPEHLSCYGLKVEEGTALWEHQARLDLADDDVQADMYLWLVERLEEAGYGHYEISNFAKPGRHSRHNMRYWLGQQYLGFGPGAHSYACGKRSSIARDLKGFCHGGFGSDNCWDEGRVVDREEQAREYIMLRMRTIWGISRAEYEALTGRDFGGIEKQLIIQGKYGWVALENDRWHFTPEGFLLSNPLIGQLLEALED